ncbi:hypothetical protein ABTZ46_02100 [Nocardioides sp. NPDC126508]
MGLILLLMYRYSHLYSQVKPYFAVIERASFLWMVSGPKGHLFHPANTIRPAQESPRPDSGRRPDSQPNLFSTGPGVKDREAAGEAGGRRPSFTPGSVEKTLENGSAAHTDHKNSVPKCGLDKLDHRGTTGP